MTGFVNSVKVSLLLFFKIRIVFVETPLEPRAKYVPFGEKRADANPFAGMVGLVNLAKVSPVLL